MSKRYVWDHIAAQLIPREDGEWVRYSDLAAARAEIERLTRAVEYRSNMEDHFREMCADKTHEGIDLRSQITRLTKERDTARNAADFLQGQFNNAIARAEKAEAERDEARAQVAAAFEAAAKALQNVADNWDCGHNESRLCDCARDAEQWGFAADDVRSLAPADAKAALEAYGREKVREGMQMAADEALQFDTGEGAYDAILSEMETLK